jgi:hypothetical protein
MAVWVVVVVLGAGVALAAVLARRHDDVEPTVREFAEFRDAIGRQVSGTATDTAATRRHVDRSAPPAQDRVGFEEHQG